jgi:hypothetical protein
MPSSGPRARDEPPGEAVTANCDAPRCRHSSIPRLAGFEAVPLEWHLRGDLSASAAPVAVVTARDVSAGPAGCGPPVGRHQADGTLEGSF